MIELVHECLDHIDRWRDVFHIGLWEGQDIVTYLRGFKLAERDFYLILESFF